MMLSLQYPVMADPQQSPSPALLFNSVFLEIDRAPIPRARHDGKHEYTGQKPRDIAACRRFTCVLLSVLVVVGLVEGDAVDVWEVFMALGLVLFGFWVTHVR